MHKQRKRGGGWAAAGWGRDVVCSVRNALQPIVRPLLDWNFIQMSLERPRNGRGGDSNMASTDGVRFATAANFWTPQRSSVPSIRQHSRRCRRVVGYFYFLVFYL